MVTYFKLYQCYLTTQISRVNLRLTFLSRVCVTDPILSRVDTQSTYLFAASDVFDIPPKPQIVLGLPELFLIL